jgi:hypothetical protein
MVQMRASVDIDTELEKRLGEAQNLTGEKQATVIRLALRLGLPVVMDRFRVERQEGYFNSAYENPERARFEGKMSKATRQRPER